MPDTGLLLKYAHVLAAMVYVTGYIAGAVLQVWVGRASEWPARRTLMNAASWFTNRLLVPSYLAAAVLGVITALVLGYPLTRGWVLYALVVYFVLLAIGLAYWSPLGKRIEASIAASDEQAFVTLRDRPATRWVSIVDGILLLLLIYLMVVKPA